MIILHVTYTCLPGTRDKVIEAAKACVKASRADDGCIMYTQFPSPDNDNDMMCVECWESKEALLHHSKGEYMKVFGEARKPFVVPGSFKMDIYEAQKTTL